MGVYGGKLGMGGGVWVIWEKIWKFIIKVICLCLECLIKKNQDESNESRGNKILQDAVKVRQPEKRRASVVMRY